MPKIVDHDARREEVAEAVLRLIARGGLDAATVRGIADEAGWSTGVVLHYFADKASMLLFALEHLMARLQARWEEVDAGGLAALRATMAAGLPLDDERRVECTVWMSFVSQAQPDDLLGERIVAVHGMYRAVLADMVRECQAVGEVDAARDPETVALTLAALADGITLEAQFGPDVWTADRQLEALDLVLDAVAVGLPV